MQLFTLLHMHNVKMDTESFTPDTINLHLAFEVC